MRKKRLTRPTASPRPLALRLLVTSLCRAALGEIIFLYFNGLETGTLNRPRPYIAATQEAGATDLTPLAALKEGARCCAPATHRKSHPSASPTPELSAGAADEAAPTPQISAHPTVQADRAPLSPSLGAATAAAPAPQVTETQTVPPETLPAASAQSAGQPTERLRIAQRLAGIRLRLGRRAQKPPPAHIKTVQIQVDGKPKYFGLILTTLLLLFMFTVAALAATLGRDKISAWLGLSPSQTEMTAALPADPIGRVIGIGLKPLNEPSAPTEQAAFVPQAKDDALGLQEADIALKDPENDAEPPIGLFAQEPPAVRALAIGPVTEPAATPPTNAEGYVAAPDPNLRSGGEAPLLDMPWLSPDPLPDKENRAPTVAQDQTEEHSAPDSVNLAEPVNIPPVTAALEQTDQRVAPLPPENASPEEANPLAAFRPMPRPASLPSPVRPKNSAGWQEPGALTAAAIPSTRD